MNFHAFPFLSPACLVCGVLATLLGSVCQPAHSDVIDVDTTAVDPQYRAAFERAEAIWESRIQNYSEDLPRQILEQVTSLQIVASTPAIDGEGGILGQAGPTGVIQSGIGGGKAVAATSFMEFDSDDLSGMSDRMREDLILHEMAHAMGFGTLWTANGLIGPYNNVGLVQYNGRYAIEGYRRDIFQPLIPYVSLEQTGGPGTALGHWHDGPPFFNQTFTSEFKKELMTGFACDLDPDTGDLVCPPNFISEATWGAMADLGFEVAGVNDNAVDPPRGNGTGVWQKVIGNAATYDKGPFELNGVPPAPGIKFSVTDFKMVVRKTKHVDQGNNAHAIKTNPKTDPYGLRHQAWVK